MLILWCTAYASADVFVIPSAFETLGNVVLEALASGVPVVGCNAGGIPHMLVSDETGYLFEPNDSEGLCAAVGRLLTDAELRKRLGENGIKHVANVSWRAASEYVADIYKRVIIQHGRLVPVRALARFPVLRGALFAQQPLSVCRVSMRRRSRAMTRARCL